MNANRTIAVAADEPGRRADRKAAILIGVLFITGTVTLPLSALFTNGVLAGPDVLAGVAAEPDRMAFGALLVLLAGFALAMIPVVFWPVGRRYDETLAVGYVVFRGAIETVLYVVIALAWLLLIALSRMTDATTLASAVRAAEAVVSAQVIAIPFSLGALMFYALLYRWRLVPRWLSIWGLVGAALYLAAPLGSMFGLSLDILMAPLAVQEMVMAVWLIIKGFSPSALAVGPAAETSRWQTVAPGTVSAT